MLENIKIYQPIQQDFDIILNANESPFDCPKNLKRQIAKQIENAQFNRYPDYLAKQLCSKYAKYIGVDAENVVAGNGSDELIGLILQTYAKSGDKVLMFDYDFSMYEFYCDLFSLQKVILNKKNNLHIDFTRTRKILENEDIKICIFSNPCNPTSLVEKVSEIKSLLEFKDTIFVVDEAYMDFCDQSMLSEFLAYDNLIILRTMSKALFAAATRCGFAISCTKNIQILRQSKSPYNVNLLTQIATCVILDNESVIKSNIAKIKRLTKQLYKELVLMCEFEVYKTNTNFVFIKTDKCDAINELLNKNGISVRKFEGFLRITSGTSEQNQKLLEVLKTL